VEISLWEPPRSSGQARVAATSQQVT